MTRRSFDQPHLKVGTLVLIAGGIPGVIVSRLSKHYYEVLTEGKIQNVHRNDMVEED